MNCYNLWMKNDAVLTIWADYTEMYRNYNEKIEYIDFKKIDKRKTEIYGQEMSETIAIADMKDVEKIRFSREKYSW